MGPFALCNNFRSTMQAATPETQGQKSTATQQLIYAVTIESTFVRGMKGKITPALKQKLREIGIDLDEKLKPAYPLEMYLKGIRLAIDLAYPGIPRDVAMKKIGETAARSFGETALGKLLVTACRLMGPHRVLGKAQTQFRTMSNYLECTTKKLGPTEYEMWLSHAGERWAYFEGVVCTFIEYGGAKHPQMKLIKRDGEAATYRISWTEGEGYT